MLEIITAIAVNNKKIVGLINQQYTQKELGIIAERLWVHCSYPQPQGGSFEMSAEKIEGDNVRLKGYYYEWLNLWYEDHSCLVPLSMLPIVD